MDVPDASADRPQRARQLPDLRHGALEPMTPTAGDAANPELRDMTRRFWVRSVLVIADALRLRNVRL